MGVDSDEYGLAIAVLTFLHGPLALFVLLSLPVQDHARGLYTESTVSTSKTTSAAAEAITI